MNARKWLSTASTVVLLGAGALIGGATSASAAPTGCSYQIGGMQASSYCASGTGEHRIHVLQRHFLPEVGLIPIEGPWVPAGQTSLTRITAHTTVAVWIDTRG
ncbi:hypothetical protein [Spongiactinospora sp. TRM90649]|uniref:hypothetical protein n=1 Tax=Spongiactinospora sp. TRM90649 TaxID=3031114 RepID=UPI0023F68F0E|nr:hypothetical protein [Spongiactinospora sp. TRM90649]MDF5757270.1 hypothetical protein [Spongiactinospora sp. TRM90649]